MTVEADLYHFLSVALQASDATLLKSLMRHLAVMSPAPEGVVKSPAPQRGTAGQHPGSGPWLAGRVNQAVGLRHLLLLCLSQRLGLFSFNLC